MVLRGQRIKPYSLCLLCYFHLSFVFAHFWRQIYKNTKILHNLCLHFARQDWQDEKKTERKSHN